MMSRLRKIMRMPVRQLGTFLADPRLISVALFAPKALPVIDALASLYPEISRTDMEAYRRQLYDNQEFLRQLNDRMAGKRQRAVTLGEMDEFLYVAVRIARPECVIETGVFDGQSSAVILQSLQDNQAGTLYSIDLPAQTRIVGSTERMREAALPPGMQPGWLIPDYLRQRHELILGDSAQELPRILEQRSRIDIFFHDSLHTDTHQYFEYTSAWPHIVAGGLLVSDDIFWSPAFSRFSKKIRQPYVRLQYFGALRKGTEPLGPAGGLP